MLVGVFLCFTFFCVEAPSSGRMQLSPQQQEEQDKAAAAGSGFTKGQTAMLVGLPTAAGIGMLALWYFCVYRKKKAKEKGPSLGAADNQPARQGRYEQSLKLLTVKIVFIFIFVEFRVVNIVGFYLFIEKF